MTSSKVTAANCRSCGACCVPSYSDAVYVGLSREDVERLTPRYRLHVLSDRWHEGGSLATKVSTPKRGPLQGAEVCSCVALRGSVGHRVSCNIYERRPEVCRIFRPGSPACLQARRETLLEEKP